MSELDCITLAERIQQSLNRSLEHSGWPQMFPTATVAAAIVEGIRYYDEQVRPRDGGDT
jgi:hypothetical protein